MEGQQVSEAKRQQDMVTMYCKFQDFGSHAALNRPTPISLLFWGPCIVILFLKSSNTLWYISHIIYNALGKKHLQK